jgi:hypothetical protein
MMIQPSSPLLRPSLASSKPSPDSTFFQGKKTPAFPPERSSKPMGAKSIPALLAAVLASLTGSLAVAQTPEQKATVQKQQVQIQTLTQQAQKQQEELSILEKKMALLSSKQSYEAFMASKTAFIQKVQAGQFILTEKIKGTDKQTGKPYEATGSSAGWVAKDKNGKLALLGCNHGVEETYTQNPQGTFDIEFSQDGFKFKTTLAKNLPNGLKPYSKYLDIASLEVPTDPVILAKLNQVAIPLPDIMEMDLPAGSEALSIGAPLDTKKFVNEGILAYYDLTGQQLNGSQSSHYPRLLTDSGTNPGNSGGPLIAYNWKQSQWQIVGATNAKQPDTTVDPQTKQKIPVQGKYQGAMCTPMSAFLAFLGERGLDTVDSKNPLATQLANQILDHDRGFVMKHKALITFCLDDVMKDKGQKLDDYLKQRGLTKQQLVEKAQPRFAQLIKGRSEFNNDTYWDCLNINDGLKNFDNYSTLKSLVSQSLN